MLLWKNSSMFISLYGINVPSLICNLHILHNLTCIYEDKSILLCSYYAFMRYSLNSYSVCLGSITFQLHYFWTIYKCADIHAIDGYAEIWWVILAQLLIWSVIFYNVKNTGSLNLEHCKYIINDALNINENIYPFLRKIDNYLNQTVLYK